MRKTSIIGIAAMAAMFSFTITSTTQAADPAIKCESGKLKEAGKYASCRMKADSKAVKKGELPDYTKCESKFSDKWSKTEAKGDGACPSNGDEAAVEAAITTCMGDVAAGLAPWVCPGVEVGGACWFLAANFDDCDTTCVGAGLSYDEATRTYAGSDGTDEQCEEVLDALGAPAAPFVGNAGYCVVEEMGCFYDISLTQRTRCDQLATDAFAAINAAQRVCACAP